MYSSSGRALPSIPLSLNRCTIRALSKASRPRVPPPEQLASKRWPPPPPPLPATAASLKWANGNSLEGARSRFLAASTDSDEALRHWNGWQVDPSRRHPSSDMEGTALHVLDNLVKSGDFEGFRALLGSPEFGGDQKQRLMRAGRLIKWFRGGWQAKNHAPRPASMDDTRALVPKIVEWAESEANFGGVHHLVNEQSECSRSTNIPANIHTEPFFKFSAVPVFDIESIMYVYCQAGYTESALALWRSEIAGAGIGIDSKISRKSVVASGLFNLLCRATQARDNHRQSVHDIMEFLNDVQKLRIQLFPGVLKGLHDLIEGLVNRRPPVGESAHEIENEVADLLDSALAVVNVLHQHHRVTPLRRTFLELLRLSSSTVHLEEFDAAGKVSRRAAEVFALLEASPLSSGPQASPPTRYEYSLLVAALAHAHGPDHFHVRQAANSMERSGLLPLTDAGILRRAESGDVAAVKGSLLVRHLQQDPLGARTATSLISILLEHHDRAVSSCSKEGEKFARQAWHVWTTFQPAADSAPLDHEALPSSPSPNLFSPDLKLFNAALAAGARLSSCPELVDGLAAELRARGEGDPSLRFDAYTFNTLIDAYGRRGEIDRCWAAVAEMEAAGVTPNIVTFNTLSNACAREGKLDDALEALEISASKGVPPDHVSFRALTSMFGESNAMVETIREAEMALTGEGEGVGTFRASRGSESLPPSSPDVAGGETPGLARGGTGHAFSVKIDLHHLGVAEAKATITRTLDDIFEDSGVEWHSVDGAGDGALSFRQNEEMVPRETPEVEIVPPTVVTATALEKRQRVGGYPELVLVTGVGRRSAVAGKSVIREAVVDMLTTEGIAFSEVPGNPGRLVVAAAELEAFFSRHHNRQLWTMGASWLSYRFALIPSLLATVLVLPKLSDFYSVAPPVG